MTYYPRVYSHAASSDHLLLEGGGSKDGSVGRFSPPSSPSVAFGHVRPINRRLARVVVTVAVFGILPLLFVGLNSTSRQALTQRLRKTTSVDWTYVTPTPVDLPRIYDGVYTRNPINSTLGFQKIVVINLAHRKDKRDEMLLLAQMSGLELTFVTTKTMDQLQDTELPYYGKVRWERGAVGSARAHADAWERMLAEGWQSALILEDDADWDVDWRYAFQQLQQPFAQLLRSVDEQDDLRTADQRQRAAGATTPTPNDPWQTSEWDLFNFGPCLEDPFGKGDRGVGMRTPLVKDFDKPPHIMYEDKTMPFQEQNGYKLIDYFRHYNRAWPKQGDPPTLGMPTPQRMVTLAHVPVCVNAYALTRTGATRFLHYVTRELYAPIDIMMAELAASDKLRSYEVIPPLMSQWKIKDNHAASSDNLLASAGRTQEELAHYKAAVAASKADPTLNHNPSIGYSGFIKNSLRAATPDILADRTRAWPV